MMANNLKASDIEAQLKAMLQLNSGSVQTAESPKKQRKPKKKKKPREKQEGKIEEASNSPNSEESPNLNTENILEEASNLSPASDPTNERLEKLGIYRLKKKSTRFPRANYFCRVCEFHCDTLADCDEHLKDRRHGRRLDIFNGDKELKDIPKPSAVHIEALTRCVCDLEKTQGLTEEDMKQRLHLVSELEATFVKVLPDISLKLYGSSVTGFGLKSSDANIDIILPHRQSPSVALVTIYKTLKENEGFRNIQSDFKAKIPSVSFDDPESSSTYHLTVGNKQARDTTELLALYNQVDPRARKLALAFRFWAKVCKVDQQMLGTMPGYVTTLLTIYFLQQIDPPVLPVLHEYSDPPDALDKKQSSTDSENMYCHNLDFLRICWKCNNTQSAGELWLEMLKFYSLTYNIPHDVVSIRQHKVVSKGEKKWSGKKLAVEDPFSRKRNVTRSVSSNLVFDYIYDSLRRTYKYFGTVNNEKGAPALTGTSSQISSADTNCKAPIVKLFPEAETVNEQPCCSKSLGNPPEILSEVLENSGNPPEILSEVLENSGNNVTVNNDIALTKYAADLSDIIIDSANLVIKELNGDLPLVEKSSSLEVEMSGTELLVIDSESSLENNCNVGHSPLGSEEVLSEINSQSDSLEEYALEIVDSVIGNAVDEVLKLDNHVLETTRTNSCEITDTLGEKVLTFSFTSENFVDGKGPATVCSICQEEGHLKQSCPEETLPELVPLPEPTPTHMKILNKFLENVPNDFAPTPQEVQERNQIVSDLERYFRNQYPDAHLSLFGSSCNGFGFRHSDLDICMTFDQPTAEGLDCVKIIESLCVMLKQHRAFRNVLAITTAKVPIVKFKHHPSGLEGDVSLYNTLAQHNTDLLQTYSLIDPRVEILGYAMKVFAKVCEIGDASRGSLSSYGYILMVLHFLQQTKPPVIPVLQELHPADESPEIIVDTWNTWFFRDRKKLPKVWPDYGKNKKSVAELWMEMFIYYTERFEFKNQVITIRQLSPLTRFEKLWNGRCIAIEDPFDLSHNLGAGLSRKMNMYIQKAFIHGRELYCTPVSRLPRQYEEWGDFFFDPARLTEEGPPTDKCCRACGKIGHFVKECPIVRNRKNREEEERKRRRDFDRSHDDDRGHSGRRENTNNSRGGRRDEDARIFPQEFKRRQPLLSAPVPINSQQGMWQNQRHTPQGMMGSSPQRRQFHGGRGHGNSPNLSPRNHMRDPHSPNNNNNNWPNPLMGLNQQLNFFNPVQGGHRPPIQYGHPNMRNQQGAPMYQPHSGPMFQQPANQQRGQGRRFYHENDAYDQRY